MCGIAGIVGSLADQRSLEQLLKPIAHRGEPSYQNEVNIIPNQLALGMHRLAIVDAPHGKQPKTAYDGKIICIFNGEIYNYVALKQELSHYFTFTSACDTEVILFSYCYWGKEFVNKLDGKFAIAIYDSIKEKLILIRDPLGVKPLYYASEKNSFLFSSEIKSFSTYSYIEDIEELPPGTLWDNGRILPYFKLPSFIPSEQLFSATSEKLAIFLNSAVSKRIPGDAKAIASLLSGGIDSSIITYLAHKTHPNVIAYTLSVPGKESADLNAAKELCKTFNITHKIVSPSILDMQQFYLHEGVYMTESFEPVLVRNAVSYHFLCRQVNADGFKYCLNGEGADELFGGYDFIREVSSSLRDKALEYSLRYIYRTYLQMADRASMYATLEARVPYMDRELVEFCLRLPPDFRINDNQNKIILRQLYKDKLPDSITQRIKVGMNEGSGYGRNIPTESIYYQAVYNFYHLNPLKLENDLKVCYSYQEKYHLNIKDIEEVYNFSRFHSYGFHRLRMKPVRLHLNTALKQDLIFEKKQLII
jgi:asparagine synthase (glutamine-hydrolysing)